MTEMLTTRELTPNIIVNMDDMVLRVVDVTPTDHRWVITLQEGDAEPWKLDVGDEDLDAPLWEHEAAS